MTVKFETGKKYTARYIGNSELIMTYEVLARTATMVTVRDQYGEVSKRKVRIYQNSEHCSPQGNHSMSLVLRAG